MTDLQVLHDGTLLSDILLDLGWVLPAEPPRPKKTRPKKHTGRSLKTISHICIDGEASQQTQDLVVQK